MKTTKRFLFLISFSTAFSVLVCSIPASSQTSGPWQRKLNSLKYYIENKGQFSQEARKGETILYGYVGESEKYFFTNDGIIIRIDRFEKKRNPVIFFKELVGEINEEEEKENQKLVSEYVFVKWNGSDNSAKIIASEASEGYYTYGREPYMAGGFGKITYQGLYPGIDFEFILPQDSNGIKYNVIIHPGADISKVSIEYSGDVKSMTTDADGNVIIETPAWNLTEHAPVARQAGNDITCGFILNGNSISFSLPGNFDPTQTLVIDPWVTGLTLSGDDLAYDVDYDYSSNLYAFIRPSGSTSVYINKYSPTGTVIWSHLSPYDFSMYEGNFIVEKPTERVYIGEGFNGSGARLYRLGANGVADGFVSVQNGNYREIWDMCFDCSGGGRIIVVGGGTSSNVNGGLVNITTGALNVANFTGIGGTCQDIVSYTIDNQSNLFVVYAKTSDYVSAAVDDKISKVNAALNGNVWMVNHGMYGFYEVSNHFPNFTVFGSTSNGFNALSVNDNYLYYYDGGGLAAYNKGNGAQLSATSVGLSGVWHTPLNQGGIAVDDCENIYLGGSNNNVLTYSFNGTTFTQTGNIPLGWTAGNQPFDVKYDRNTNLLFVSGRKFVGVYSASASIGCNLMTATSGCNGPNDGTATVTINSPTANPIVTYIWYDSGGGIISQTNNSTLLTNTVNGLANGTYTVNAQLNPPCGPMFIETVVIQCPSCYTTIAPTNVSCYGGNNGGAVATPTGGPGPYTYTWSPTPGTGQGTTTAGNLTAGTWTISVTDGNGCTSTASVTITEPPQVTAAITGTTDVLCFGGNNGSATAAGGGGTPGYTYLWSNSQTSATASGLTANTYTCTVYDANNCTATATTVINQPTAIQVTIGSVTNITCYGGNNGSATATASGGSPGYTYLWTNGQTTAAATGLIAGNQYVTVTDINNCTAVTSVNITEPQAITAVISAFTDVTCAGGNNGSATVTASSGTPAYSYLWSNSQTMQTATGLAAGTYTITVTDANFCSTTTSATISAPTPVIATISNIVNVSCYDGNDGSATVTASGGTPGYTYSWSAGQSNPIAVGLSANNYNVVVSDINNCTTTAYVTITQPPVLTLMVTPVTDVTCFGLTDGTATAVAGGGTPGYAYFWSNYQNTAQTTGLGAGTYNVTIVDSKGCMRTSGVIINEPDSLFINSSPDNTICQNESAFLSINAFGGTPTYQYYWNGILSTSMITISPESDTVLYAMVIDNNGCISNFDSTIIHVGPPLNLLLLANTDYVCPGDPVLLTISISGGFGPPYMITNQDDLVVYPPMHLNPTDDMSYIVTATDICGTRAVDTVDIHVIDPPPNHFIADTTAGCQPFTVQFLETSPSSGQTYVWNFGDNSDVSLSKNPTHVYEYPGTYNVSLTVTSPQGCKNIDTLYDFITVYPRPHSQFVWDPQFASILKPFIQFTNLSQGAFHNFWFFGDGDSASALHPYHKYPNAGDFIVLLVTVSDRGCTDTAEAVLTIKDDFTIYAPTAFSPDFNSINDIWYITGHNIRTEGFHIAIFDRWGEVIWETDKYNPNNPAENGWDGKNKAGNIVKVDTYVWLVHCLDQKGNDKEFSGYVTVIK